MANFGYLEEFNTRQVSGWAYANEACQSVTLVFNQSHSVNVMLDIKRSDLPDQAFGFCYTLPDFLKTQYPLSVSCIGPNGNELDNSPKSIETRPSEIEKVLIGKNGWLFLCNDSNHSLKYLTGERPADIDLIRQWIDLIQTRINTLASAGIPFVQCIVAEKEAVYDDMLPDNIFISDVRPATLLIDGLEMKITLDRYFYYGPTKSDLTVSASQLYYKGDTHYTHYGAELVARELLSRLATQLDAATAFPSIPQEFQYRITYQASDLLAKVEGVNIEQHDYPSSHCRPILHFSTTEPKTGRIRAVSNPDGHGRLLVFHTSSIDWMAPFLNDAFRHILYFWSGKVDYTLVNWFQPDYVIAQTNERFLTHCPLS